MTLCRVYIIVFLSLLLAAFLPAQSIAEGIVVDQAAPQANQPILDQAANGVPIVNTVAPNGSGTSINLLSDYNVSSKGVVINNSAFVGQSGLAGLVQGNPNLRNVAAAGQNVSLSGQTIQLMDSSIVAAGVNVTGQYQTGIGQAVLIAQDLSLNKDAIIRGGELAKLDVETSKAFAFVSLLSGVDKGDIDAVTRITKGLSGKSNRNVRNSVYFSKNDFPNIKNSISVQKQNRHVAGTREYRGSGVFKSREDAQRVLEAYHSEAAKIIGKNAKGQPIVRFDGVTGVNINRGAGVTNQPTNVFLIKGTKNPSVVPINPKWRP